MWKKFFKSKAVYIYVPVWQTIYMYGDVKKIPHMWHMTYMASTIHIPYIFAHIPYIDTHTVWTWGCMFVCRHLWQRCLKRGQREVFMQSRPSGMASPGTRIIVTQWPWGTENFPFWKVNCCGAFKQAFPDLPHSPVRFSDRVVPH